MHLPSLLDWIDRRREAVRAQGVEFEQLIVPDEVHVMLMHEHWLKAYHATEEFLGRKLKK